MKIINVVGARPNFMKIAPIIRAMDEHNRLGKRPVLQSLLVHTGQHYDYQMSKAFWGDLQIPEPDVHLHVGSGTHAVQTGRAMMRFEAVLMAQKPDLVTVVGDVNSTLACALAAAKLLVPVAHVEAGMRSFDRTMPEEINRVLTDVVSTFLFTPGEDAVENLVKEGIPRERIFEVGDVMVDSLLYSLPRARASPILDRLGLSGMEEGSSRCAHGVEYAVLTLHRPHNVDDEGALTRILRAADIIAQHIPIVFPIHPRTRKRLKAFGLDSSLKRIALRSVSSSRPARHHVVCGPGVYLTNPLGYLDFIKLMMESKLVMTDSGGIQAETTVLGVPCLTLRDSTERPITLKQGTNTLVSNDTEGIVEAASRVLAGRGQKSIVRPALWDGRAAERIVRILSSPLPP